VLADHDEAAAAVSRDGGGELSAGGARHDLELFGDGAATAREAAAEHAPVIAVLHEALPDHDEVAVGLEQHRRVALIAGEEGVDQELAADRHDAERRAGRQQQS
jgi:hypothetical protein